MLAVRIECMPSAKNRDMVSWWVCLLLLWLVCLLFGWLVVVGFDLRQALLVRDVS